MYEYVFHDTSGPNRGQTSKTPWFLSNEICTDTRLLASCGKGNLRRSDWDLDGNKYRIVNVYPPRRNLNKQFFVEGAITTNIVRLSSGALHEHKLYAMRLRHVSYTLFYTCGLACWNKICRCSFGMVSIQTTTGPIRSVMNRMNLLCCATNFTQESANSPHSFCPFIRVNMAEEEYEVRR